MTTVSVPGNTLEVDLADDTDLATEGSNIDGGDDKLSRRPTKMTSDYLTKRKAISEQYVQVSQLRNPKAFEDKRQFMKMISNTNHNQNDAHNATAKTDEAKERDRQIFMANLYMYYSTTGTSRLVSFHSVPTMRAQLLSGFIFQHYTLGPDFSPSKLIILDAPETASFAAASNALYLTQLATSNQDQKLLGNAMQSYQGALHLLRKDLSRPKACDNDGLYATIHVLSLCEEFSAISINDGVRKQHTKGVASLLETRGPQSIKSGYMRLQLQLHQQQVLWDTLLSRKSSVAGRDSWLGIQKQCPVKLTELTNLGLRVPAALEDADALCLKGSLVELDETMNLLSHLKSLERDMFDWMTNWYARFDVLPYWKVPASSFPWLPSFAKQEKSAFESVFEFPTVVFAKAHVMMWMPLQVLRQTIKDVAAAHPFPLLAETGPKQTQKLDSEIMECADNLCMAAVYLCNLQNGFDGYIQACGPLLLASMWYEQCGETAKHEWCRGMISSIEAKGIRIPSTDPEQSVRQQRDPGS